MNEIEKHSNKNIKIGAVIGYISLILNIASGAVFVPLILKQIGNEYGLFSLATSIINLFLVDFGLSATANVFLTKFKTNGETSKIQDYLGIFYKLYFFLDLILLAFFVCYFFAIDYIYAGLTYSELISFKKIFIICVGYSLLSLPATTLDGLLSAYEKYSFLKTTDLIQKLVYITITVFTLLFELGLTSFVLAHAASVVIAIVSKLVYVKIGLRVKANLKIRLNADFLKPIIAFSLWTAIISILARLPFNLSPNILGIVSNSENVTVFGIASTIEGYAYLISAVISGFFLPKVSRAIKENGKNLNKLNEMAINVGCVQLFIIGLIFVGFIVCGKSFLNLWLSDYEKFKFAYYGTILIIFNLVLNVPQTIYNNAAYVLGHVKELASVDIISTALFVALCFVLSKFYGVLGACISICLSKLISFIAKNIIFKVKMGFDVKDFYKKTYAKMIIPFCSAPLLIVLFNQLETDSWILLLRKILTTTCLFLIVYLPLLNKKQKKMIIMKVLGGKGNE